MDKLAQYRNYIENLLQEYGNYKPSYGDVEMQLIFDRERDRYQLMSVGWNKNRRIHGIVLHVDIKDGKIWIHHDGTEAGIAKELLALGVPNQDIVLAFHAPARRKYTEFAAG